MCCRNDDIDKMFNSANVDTQFHILFVFLLNPVAYN